jgi:hypothetical protein
MKYQIPKTFMGKPVEGAMKRVLEGNPTPPNIPRPNINLPLVTLNNPQDYILLSGKDYGSWSYSDLLVSKYRLGMSPEAGRVALGFGYSVANTAKESSGRAYIGNINWEQALKLNLGLGGRTLNPRQFADFLLLLKSGDVVDGSRQIVGRNELDGILDEIVTVRDPYRAEWLDADFKYVDNLGKIVSSSDPSGRLWIYSEHLLQNGDVDSNHKEVLESCLMTKGSRINLSTMNDQGMPTQEGSDFHYWCSDKDNKSVAGFVANSVGAGLNCGRNPTGTNPSLGVRFCMPKARAKNN